MTDTLVPAYVWPGFGDRWAKILELAPNWIVAPPANGVGGAYSPQWSDLIIAASQRRIRTAGYVATGYGLKPLGEIQREIALWRSRYGVCDVFFDEVSLTLPASWYKQLHEMVRNQTGPARVRERVTFWNPGTSSLRTRYLMTLTPGGNWVTFEGTADDYLARRPRPLWFPKRQIHLVHSAAGVVEQVKRAAEASGVRWAYVTIDVLPNPWDEP